MRFLITNNMEEKTVREHMRDTGFSEDEIHEHLNKLSKEIMGLTLMRISELFPEEEREALAKFSEDARGREIASRAPRYLTKEECREIETEERQKRVDEFYKKEIVPRREGNIGA